MAGAAVSCSKGNASQACGMWRYHSSPALPSAAQASADRCPCCLEPAAPPTFTTPPLLGSSEASVAEAGGRRRVGCGRVTAAGSPAAAAAGAAPAQPSQLHQTASRCADGPVIAAAVQQ